MLVSGREMLDYYRKNRSPEVEIALMDFLDLTEQEQREVLYIGLLYQAWWMRNAGVIPAGK